jgi:outer membrane protein assembly factor BamB
MRKWVSATAVIAGICGAAFLSASSHVPISSFPHFPISPLQGSSTPWPQFRNTPALTGVASSPVPATLRLQWTYEAGTSVDSSAAVVDGVAYVGTMAGKLLAIDTASGKLKWSYTAASDDLGIGESSPAVAGGLVYIGDLAGVFHAVDVATGKVRWTYKTGAEIKSSPVVVGDKVLIGSYDGHLYGLNAATGKFLWKASTDNYVHATPAIWNGVAYFGGCDEIFHGVRISDGSKVLSLPTQAYTAASPAIAAGIAYYGTFANEVVAVDIAAKRVKWRFVDPDRQFPFYSSAALSGSTMVLGGRDKNVRALDMATGKQRWSFPTRARVESSPAISGSRVFVGSSDGKFYVLDLGSGKKIWEFEAGAPFTASPAIADGRVIIGDGDGRVYAFGQ